MDNMNHAHPQMMHTSGFELYDFTRDAHFDQFIDLVRGENDDQISDLDCDLINDLLVDDHFSNPTHHQDDIFNLMLPDQNYVPITLPSFDGDVKEYLEDDIDGEENSSGTTITTTTTTTTSPTRKTKTDRSRTLISERKRRGRMKDKLYALRSLVPNITKMDKASIIGDAVLYVQELQKQAKKLKTEIAGLETSLARTEKYQGSKKNSRKIQIEHNNNPISKKIIQIDVFQVEERGFYVRLVSNKGEGIAASLYKTLGFFTSFRIQSSNLTTASERYIFTFTLIVKENEKNMNLSNLRLWIKGALLNQGFEFLTALSN